MSATDTNTASAHSSRAAWALMLAAAAIMMLTMGARQTMGLFLSPLNTATGLGIASISLALAVGQLGEGKLALVHAGHHAQFGAVGIGHLAVHQRLGDHADNLAARAQRARGDRAHQP